MGFGLGDIGDFVFGGGDSVGQTHDAYDKARQQYEGLKPDIEIQQQGPSAYASADPRTRAAQLDALNELQNTYRQGGMTAIDRGRLGDIQQGVAQAGQTASAGAQQDAARRGSLNGASALMSQQMASQRGLQLGEQQARDAAGLAQQGRMQAITGAGGLANEVRGQDYQRAQAEDAISRFNTANRQGQLQRNYGNALDRAHGIAGGYRDQASAYQRDADRRRQEMAGLYTGFGSAIPMGGGSGSTGGAPLTGGQQAAAASPTFDSALGAEYAAAAI